jgi:Domain of unknown function (DUF1840)
MLQPFFMQTGRHHMLVRFSSLETESVLMFGDVASQLIRMLGASGAVPGAIDAESIPAAVQRLRQQLALQGAAGTSPSGKTKEDDADQVPEPPVGLGIRAQPLIDILERAAAAKVPVMWEVG